MSSRDDGAGEEIVTCDRGARVADEDLMGGEELNKTAPVDELGLIGRCDWSSDKFGVDDAGLGRKVGALRRCGTELRDDEGFGD